MFAYQKIKKIYRTKVLILTFSKFSSFNGFVVCKTDRLFVRGRELMESYNVMFSEMVNGKEQIDLIKSFMRSNWHFFEDVCQKNLIITVNLQ
jgi:hypothetical protein